MNSIAQKSIKKHDKNAAAIPRAIRIHEWLIFNIGSCCMKKNKNLRRSEKVYNAELPLSGNKLNVIRI